MSAPAEAGGDIFEDRLDDVGVIVDTKLIRDGQEQCVSLCDSFWAAKLGMNLQSSTLKNDESGRPFHVQQAEDRLKLCRPRASNRRTFACARLPPPKRQV